MIFLHSVLLFCYVHCVKIRLYVDHADCIKGHYSVWKKLPGPRGNFVLSSTEEFRWGPVSQQGYSQSIRMSVRRWRGRGGGVRGSWICECTVPFIRPRRALLSPSPKLLFIYVMHGNDKSAVINCPCALEDLRREVEGTRHSCPLTNSGCGGREELLEGLECQGKKEVALCARGLVFLGGGRCL